METVADREAEVRIRYRKLLREIEDMQEELAIIENHQLMGFMMDSEDLFANVSDCQAATIDAKVMKLLARLVRLQAEQMSTNITQFSYQEYGERLLASMQVEREQVVTKMKMIGLGKHFKTFFMRSPPLTFLYGALDCTPPPPPQRKEKAVRSSRACKVGDLVETISSQVTVVESAEKQTEQLVTEAFRALVVDYKKAKRMPIDYFRFVLDPDSFGSSIENMFHVSFLVKEGKAAISLNEETGLPVIWPVGTNAVDGQEEVKNQVVMNINMEDWAKMVDSLGIVGSVIKRGAK